MEKVSNIACRISRRSGIWLVATRSQSSTVGCRVLDCAGDREASTSIAVAMRASKQSYGDLPLHFGVLGRLASAS